MALETQQGWVQWAIAYQAVNSTTAQSQSVVACHWLTQYGNKVWGRWMQQSRIRECTRCAYACAPLLPAAALTALRVAAATSLSACSTSGAVGSAAAQPPGRT
jgi:hypothetical protein